ncbi:MAG: MFS transporter [Methanospirillum sp.]|nr:MFS transporter [Methanospirillum sp.]
MVMAGESMLTAALPEIEHELSVPGIFESWILPAVLLVGVAASPFVGTAGDLYGHKRMLILSLVIYLVGVTGGLVSPDIWVLLFCRGLQGAGIAAIPLAYAIMRNQLPRHLSSTAVGVLSAMYGAGTFVGVIIGSIITGFLSWRMTYALLIPVTLLLILLVYRWIRDDRPKPAKDSPDLAGFISLLLFLGTGLTLVSLPSGQYAGISRLLLLFLCLLFFVVFLSVEKRVSRPLADFRIISHKPVAVFMFIGFLSMIVYFILLQMMPYIIRLPSGLSLSSEMVGYIIVPGTICDMAAGAVTGWMLPYLGCRIPCITGSLLLLGTGLLLFFLPVSVPVLVIAWMLFAFGMSVLATAGLIGAMNNVSARRTAEVTGLIQGMQTLGGMAGPVITGFLLSTSQVIMMYQEEEWIVPEAGTYHLIYGTVIAGSLLLLLVSWFLVGDTIDSSGEIS